eukprot:TRINITY_DN524_c0_g1_i1.p1 TRINITY_DN524_c0_g1~~TRINITY_DN524_c0_g1_i1.p1  ORF type:complete len:411 (-),score=30.63 TRINITY_DN524_c0_g1_i1:279-1511(-)
MSNKQKRNICMWGTLSRLFFNGNERPKSSNAIRSQDCTDAGTQDIIKTGKWIDDWAEGVCIKQGCKNPHLLTLFLRSQKGELLLAQLRNCLPQLTDDQLQAMIMDSIAQTDSSESEGEEKSTNFFQLLIPVVDSSDSSYTVESSDDWMDSDSSCEVELTCVLLVKCRFCGVNIRGDGLDPRVMLLRLNGGCERRSTHYIIDNKLESKAFCSHSCIKEFRANHKSKKSNFNPLSILSCLSNITLQIEQNQDHKDNEVVITEKYRVDELPAPSPWCLPSTHTVKWSRKRTWSDPLPRKGMSRSSSFSTGSSQADREWDFLSPRLIPSSSPTSSERSSVRGRTPSTPRNNSSTPRNISSSRADPSTPRLYRCGSTSSIFVSSTPGKKDVAIHTISNTIGLVFSSKVGNDQKTD